MSRATAPAAEPATQAWQDEGGEDHPYEEPGPVTVTDYDANGEAVDVPVDTTAPVGEQAEMPGFEKPELWDRFEGRRISKVILSFAGTCDLSDDPELARQLHLREEVAFTIEGQVTGKAFKLRTDKNGVTTVDGVATINVTSVYAALAPHVLDVDPDSEVPATIEKFEELAFKDHEYRPDDDMVCRDCGEGAHRPWHEEAEQSPLAESLIEAGTLEPGMCGRVHNGHLNPCRQSAHACPLRQAEDH